MEIKTLPVGFIGTNCYILAKGKQALVIDPGGDAELIRQYLENNGLEPLAILLTHAHYDHIGGVEELKNHFSIETYLHEAELSWLNTPMLNGSYKLMSGPITVPDAEKTLEEGELSIGDFTFQVIHTPGHSPGSMSFIFNDVGQVFSGDVLFNQGIGRTDLAGGDFSALEHSVRNKLYQLAEHYEIFPGHGPSTTIGFEKQHNPFFQA